MEKRTEGEEKKNESYLDLFCVVNGSSSGILHDQLDHVVRSYKYKYG